MVCLGINPILSWCYHVFIGPGHYLIEFRVGLESKN